MFVGKGGAGKTTLAAATALRAAMRGRRTLLVALDQTRSLGDVLGRGTDEFPVGELVELPFGGDTGAGEESVSGRLAALDIDTLALLEERYASVAPMLTSAVGGGPVWTALAPGELTGVPGVQEVLGLAQIAEHAASGEFDAIVVDCPATADALRTLSAPKTFADYLERVWPRHDRAVALSGNDPRQLLLVSVVERVASAVASVEALLADPGRTSTRIVTTGERVALAHTRRLLTVASLAGLRVDLVVLNRVRGTGQAVGDLADLAGSVEVRTVGASDHEPIGWAGLARIGDELYDDVDPVALQSEPVPAFRVAHESGSGLDSVYTLRMPLPLADASTLTLGRVDDDLVVGAEGVRRRLTLPSVLRRCTVSAAELDTDALVVRFRPNPEVWPA
ncbi:ArsA-related P-loop ATPase [Rhodococcus sp. HNM0569]|uniref:ArsA family ATPase n=1 Tax=Rhodococcus sp. HNM0569 TaxID=2716340 RepID=UPI003211D9F2